ncbi:element excision factor XisI family protein [Nostoc sp.]
MVFRIHAQIQIVIANQLVELCVSKEDIVLGFALSKMRNYNDFAVG